ncbi:MAG: argininosuccinate lyase [Desulfitobacteriaceae bacterium]
MAENGKFPADIYRRVVLEPIFEQMREYLFYPMMKLNHAHGIMLIERGLLSPEEGKRILAGLKRITDERVQALTYDGQFEDLFFYIEELLGQEIGHDLAGKLHTARSRNDMDVTIYRLVLREMVLKAMQALANLHQAVLTLAGEHLETVMPGYTHTQPAQPTTLAHYLVAVADVLERDFGRLQHVYLTTNRSPMGAAAFTTTGFPIDRARVQALLGFDALVENSYDAIGGADYLLEAAAVLAVAAVNTGKWVNDLLRDVTQEFGAIRVGDGYVQISSIMPQKRNPVSLEHSRALLSTVLGDAQSVQTVLHNTPFGDIVDTEDDLQSYLWRGYARFTEVLELLTAMLPSLEVNKPLLERRALESFSTVTELADTLVRKSHVSFRQAHGLVSALVRHLMAQSKALSGTDLSDLQAIAGESMPDLMEPLQTLTDEDVHQALDPRHFVELRSVVGGPNPQEVSRMMESRAEETSGEQEWLALAREKLHKADQLLQTVVRHWE